MSRKADIFKEEDFKLLDEHATSVPLHLIISGSLQDVVSYLTSHSDCNSELATVRAIFKWVTSAQVFKIQNYSGLESSNLAREIKTASLAELMKNTCSLAGISCEVVKGFKKCSAYEIDEHLNTNAVSDWNVVNIDKSWRLMDPNFASRKVVNKESGKWKEIERDGTAMNRDIAASEGITVHEYDEFFFLTDPDHLTWTHFPLESTWQLLKQPVTQNEFENHFYARRGLFDLNMTYDASTQSNYIMKTKEGEVEFRFRLPPERSSKYSFTYHLYIAKANSLTRNIEAALDKLVFYELNESCVTFSVRCPVKGYFQLKVFGHDE